MQKDHSTRLNPDTIDHDDFDRADDLLMALGETGLEGINPYQLRLIGKIGEMLSAAVSLIDRAEQAAGCEVTMLVRKASNVALAMRTHGGTIRGAEGAALLEDLCDVATGRFISSATEGQKDAKKAQKVAEGMPVEEAMRMVCAETYSEFARMMKTSLVTIRNWRAKGVVPVKKTDIILSLSKQAHKVAA